MRRQGIRTFVLNMTVLSWVGGFCIACATPPMNATPGQKNLLLAEHSAMKKRLPLVERENDVLTKENGHYRKSVRDLNDNIDRLTGELAAAREQFSRELNAKQEQIDRLELSMQIMNEEQREQVASLNQKISTQEKTFSAQRAQILKEKDQQTSTLSTQLAEKKKELKDKVLEVDGLVSANAELKKDLENKALEISQLASAKSDLEKALENKTREMALLASVNEKNLQKLQEATEAVASLKKARDKFMAELESARAANADLVRTFNELFNQLQLEKDQTGTKI